MSPDKLGIALRIGLFIFLAWLGLFALAFLMVPMAGSLVAATLSTFGAAAIANAVTVRIFERGTLADLGLAWSATSGRECLWGIGCGVGGALLVLGVPLLTGMARFESAPGSEHPWSSLLFVTVLLMFGALGEEMLFHGYAFQLLVRSAGPYASILPFAVIFGAAHSGNLNATLGGLVNTVLWGALLGWGYYRTQSLWLPVGLHFGWNFTLPLFGENLSGFTMGVTGHTLHWNVGALWSGGAYGPEGSILTTVAAVALFFVLVRFGPKVENGEA